MPSTNPHTRKPGILWKTERISPAIPCDDTEGSTPLATVPFFRAFIHSSSISMQKLVRIALASSFTKSLSPTNHTNPAQEVISQVGFTVSPSWTSQK